jgi:hypothetical protein
MIAIAVTNPQRFQRFPSRTDPKLRELPAMNLASPVLNSAATITGFPGHSATSLLQTISDGVGLFPDDSPDGSLGLAMSGLAGAAAALAVALILTVYFRTGYRSLRDMVRHGLAAALVVGLLAFAAFDMRHAALAYLGIDPAKPAAEFEFLLPKAAATTRADSRGHTGRNRVPSPAVDIPASKSHGVQSAAFARPSRLL